MQIADILAALEASSDRALASLSAPSDRTQASVPMSGPGLELEPEPKPSGLNNNGDGSRGLELELNISGNGEPRADAPDFGAPARFRGLPADILLQQSQYAFDPNSWVRDMFGSAWDPDPWQDSVLDDFIEHRFVAISSGTGPGKTAALAALVLFFLSTRPSPRIVCTAKTQAHLRNVLWAEIYKWQHRNPWLRETFKWTQTKISMQGKFAPIWFAVAVTARPEPGEQSMESLQGIHEENVLVVVDEASGVPDQAMNAIDGLLTTPGAYAVLAGNPLRRSGYFFNVLTNRRLWIENNGVWKVHFVSSEDSKHADKAMIERAIKIYGKDSDYYRVKVKGLPPHAESHALISPEEMFDAHERKLPAEGLCVLSCDPARYGDDPSVFYVRRGWTIIDRVQVRGMSTTLVTKIGLDLFQKYDPDFYCIDEIGIGAGVVDQTKKELDSVGKSSRVLAINVGNTAFEQDRFFNLRSELFWSLRIFVNQSSIVFDTELLDEELTSIHYGWDNKDAKIRIQKKDEIRQELKRSPNDADAFALLFYPDLQKNHGLGQTLPDYFGFGRRGSPPPLGAEPKVEPNAEGEASTYADLFFTRSYDKGHGFSFSAGPVGSSRYDSLRR